MLTKILHAGHAAWVTVEVASLTCAENFALSVAKNKEQKSMDTEAASLTYAGKVCIPSGEKSKKQITKKFGRGGGKPNIRRKSQVNCK